MEDTIRVALARWRDRQPNMKSETFRNNLAHEIALLLKEKGTYKEYTKDELREQLDREMWVCGICGESTYNVEYDGIGTGTNHLMCELEFSKEDNNNYVYSGDMKEGMERARELAQEGLEEGLRREKNSSQKEHEDKVFGHDQDGDDVAKALGHMDEEGNFITQAEEVDGMYFDDEVKEWEEAVGYVEPDNDTDVELRDKVFEEQKHTFYENTQKQLYTEMTSDGLPEGGDAQAVKESHRLAEELVDRPLGYIYESPDGGETIFQRKVGESKRTKLTNEEWETIKNEKK
jgi:hypothetical protein